MTLWLLGIPVFLFVGQIIVGGCSCCAYCGMCEAEITQVQVQIVGVAASLDTATCCTDMNATYVLSDTPANCCWSKSNTPGSNCATAACSGCFCTHDHSGCGCAGLTDPNYCDPATVGTGDDCSETGTTTSALTGGGAGGNCDTCEGQTGFRSTCGPIGLQNNCVAKNCDECGTCRCRATGTFWPDPLVGGEPAFAVAGEEIFTCQFEDPGCDDLSGCSAEYSNTQVCLTTSGSDGVIAITGNISGEFSASKTFTGAADTAIDCATDLDIDAVAQADWTWTAAGSGMCLTPTQVNITVT